MLRKQGKSRLVVAALAAAVALGFGAMTWSSPTVEAAPQNITGGYLDWGVKASFRNYILFGPAAGSITLSQGALQNGDGTFRFPAVATGSYDSDTDTTTSSYSGKVFFTGHSGALEMEVTDIRVQITGTTGLLIADVVSRGLAPPGLPVAYPDVEFAALDLTSVPPNETGTSVSWTNMPSILTAAGVPAFADFYAEGTALDPVSPTLQLEPEPIGDLTWKISQHAWTSSSLSPSHATGAPAAKDVVNGFVWPTFDVINYDRITGATELSFDGSITLGNVMQGGYRIMFDNPRIIIDEDNDGEIHADVSYCVSAAACLNPWVGPALDVTLTTFIANPGGITDNGSHVSWTFTPEYSSVGNQFDQELIDTLDASLRGHFRATGGASDPNKPPAPISVQFDYVCPSAQNSDANFIENSPFVNDDGTMVRSDTAGNACDGDDDNDGLNDLIELGTPCASATGATNPDVRDSDGDRVLDGIECTMNFDPASALSKPTVAQCVTQSGAPIGMDTDGDKIRDYIEVCYYGTGPTVVDTDGDAGATGAKDGCEVASLNPDRIVNVADMGMLASAIGNPTFRIANVDINKDGAWNPADQGILAGFIAPAGQCP